MTRSGEAFQELGPVDGHCLSSVLLSVVDWLTSTDLMIVFCNSGRLLAGDEPMVLLAEGVLVRAGRGVHWSSARQVVLLHVGSARWKTRRDRCHCKIVVIL